MARKAVFSEGRTLCVRLAWPNVCRGIPFSRDGPAGPGRPRGHASVKPVPSYPGVRSPPLREMGKRWGAGLPGANPEMRERRFSRRGAVSAPIRQGITDCERFRQWARIGEKPVAQRGHASIKPGLSLRACGARPSAGGLAQHGWPRGGRPGDGPKGDFLGGMRSARPQRVAQLKPRDIMITHGRAKNRWPNGAIFWWRQSLASGRTEPAPPRGARPKTGRLAGKVRR